MAVNKSKLTELLDITRDFVITAGELRFPSINELDTPLTFLLVEEEANPQRLYDYGILLDFKKSYAEAIQCFEKAHQRYMEMGDLVGTLYCMVELAWLKYNNEGSQGEVKANLLLADIEKLIEQNEESMDLADCRARLLHRTGLIKYKQNKVGEAVRHFREAMAFCEGNEITLAKILDSMAIHYERTADYHRATKSLRRSLEIKKKVGQPHELAITAQILGRFYFLMEEFVLALRCLDFALQLSAHLGDNLRAANIKNDMVHLLITMNRHEEAMELIQELEQENKSRNLKVPQSETLLYKCFIHFARQEYELCRDTLENDVIPNFRKYKSKKWLGISRRLEGATQYHLGNERAAIEAMGDAMDLFREAHKIDELARTHYEIGKLYADMGKSRLALPSLLEALKIAEQNGLVTLTSYIEDEIFRIDKDEWQNIVQKRANHERIFEKQPNLLDALSALAGGSGSEGDTNGAAPGNNNNGQIKSLISLLRVGQAMAGEREVDKLLAIITEETKLALDADRCTVFLYDKDKNELWSKVASGLDSMQEIRFPAHLGIAGYVAKTGETLNIPNAYDDPRFNKEVDKRTGYKTENILCMPMRNRKMEIIGVFQVLNKRTGPFGKAEEDLLMTITATSGVAIENAKLVNDQKIAFESFIKTLSSTIDARDPITAGHSARVSDFSVLLGDEMKLANEDVEVVKYAALLHDIGKIGIKEEVLTKDGRLTQQEYKHIQKHAYYTYEILKNIHFEGHLVQVPEVAASHHEKMDGTGYFRKLAGPEIPLLGRIVAISDVFDAITSKRHYRSRMPFDKVLTILHRDSGSHFDPDCVETFFNIPFHKILSVILRDHANEQSDEFLKRFNQFDRYLTLREFEDILQKEADHRTRGEHEVFELFSSFYVQE